MRYEPQQNESGLQTEEEYLEDEELIEQSDNCKRIASPIDATTHEKE